MELCKSAGASIINMSLGGPSSSTVEQDAINALYDDGVLLVAAAANSGSTEYEYPASYNNVLSVGAFDENEDIASFSTHNDKVDLSGPGVKILSTTSDGGYGYKQGTSMASPHVAALASLLWNQFPHCTNTEIITAMQEAAKDLGTPGYDIHYGHGAAKY